METTLRGVGVSHGVAIGEVRHMGTAVLEPPAKQIPAEEAEREQGRARQAVEAVAADLIARGNLAGGEAQHVLEAQAMMAQDPELMADVDRRIAVGSTAERGVYDAFAAYRALLANAGEYLAGRVADLDDVRNRIVARLLGVPMPGVPDSDEPYVLIARDLAPADTALLDPALVLGFVTEEGGPTSHSAILARALGVPAVVALPGAGELAEGTVVAVDGSTGEIFVDPSAEKRAELEAAAAARRAALSASTGPGATSDGHKVPLLANIGGPADVPAAVEAGAEGVGLFRTEFLFLDDSKQAPSEEKQVEAYRKVLEAFPEGRVVVRVLDAGADKPLDFLTPAEEPNPALGVRGLRSLLDHPDVLRTQLTALAKAASRACRCTWRSWHRWSRTVRTPRRSRTRAVRPGCGRSSARWSRFRPPRCGRARFSRRSNSFHWERTTWRSTPSPLTGRSVRCLGSRTRGSRRCSTWWRPRPTPRRPRARAVACVVRLRPIRCSPVC